MLKQLWKSVEDLKTPERRLLFGLMLAIIVVLWMSFRDSNNSQAQQIRELKETVKQQAREKETQRILLQDKIDQCNEERFNDMKYLLNESEKLKNQMKETK